MHVKRTNVIHGSTPVEIGTGIEGERGDESSDRAQIDLIVIRCVITWGE